MFLTLTVVAFLGQSDCTRLSRPDAGVLTLDVDADGRPDVARFDDGVLTLALSSGEQRTTSFLLEKGGGFDWRFEPLSVKRNRATEPLFDFVERNAFEEVCSKPDPSMARLMEQQRRGRGAPIPLVWSEGPASMPRWYTLRTRDTWITYRGRFHVRPDLGRPSWAARFTRGDDVLLASAHGLVLTNLAQTRHAWLYVADSGIGLLRHASVTNPRFEGNHAVVDRVDPEAPAVEVVEIELSDGAIRVRRVPRH